MMEKNKAALQNNTAQNNAQGADRSSNHTEPTGISKALRELIHAAGRPIDNFTGGRKAEVAYFKDAVSKLHCRHGLDICGEWFSRQNLNGRMARCRRYWLTAEAAEQGIALVNHWARQRGERPISDPEKAAILAKYPIQNDTPHA